MSTGPFSTEEAKNIVAKSTWQFRTDDGLSSDVVVVNPARFVATCEASDTAIAEADILRKTNLLAGAEFSKMSARLDAAVADAAVLRALLERVLDAAEYVPPDVKAEADVALATPGPSKALLEELWQLRSHSEAVRLRERTKAAEAEVVRLTALVNDPWLKETERLDVQRTQHRAALVALREACAVEAEGWQPSSGAAVRAVPLPGDEP